MKPRKYKVVMEIEVNDNDKIGPDKTDVDDETYIEEELGWANESFSRSYVVNVKRIKDE